MSAMCERSNRENVTGEKKPSRKFDWADTNIGVNKKKAAT